jgi:TPR repeat protein
MILNSIEEAEDLYSSGDYAKALKIIEPLAKQGYAKAQHLLGTMYCDGLGVGKNNVEALKWYRKAGEQDYFNAFTSLYFMYKDGQGTKKDNTEALKWLRKAGEQGDYYALMELVDMYKKGKGVKKDNAEVFKWLSKAAQEEHDFGLRELGLMYYEGNGVTQDYTEAANWFRKAFEKNYGGVSNNLGLMYLEGLGVQKDYIEAARCFNWGAEIGEDECQKNLLDMYKKGLIRESDDISLVKLFRKAEEGDTDLQLRFEMRKATFRDYCNKLTFFIICGLLTMPLLAWYDWVMFADIFVKSGAKAWIIEGVLISIALGFFIKRKISFIIYQITPDVRVSGIPFPEIFYEPESEGSDVWIDFYGSYTDISWILNTCYYIIISLAIALTLINWKIEANL